MKRPFPRDVKFLTFAKRFIRVTVRMSLKNKITMSIKSVSLVNGNDRKVLSNIKQLVPIITVSNKFTIKWHIYENIT